MRITLGKPLSVKGKYVMRKDWRESVNHPYHYRAVEIDSFIPTSMTVTHHNQGGVTRVITDGYYRLVSYS